ncbi:MAG TPA: NAD(P)-binding domain-containing protein [Acidimicrobiia bacterium]|nr:NAD(P)-binding domain-containing protein [Acidimicrobiia bacterium]
MNHFDVVVVGGGQAGLGVGHYLQAAGSKFVIFERGRVGETWRSQRWDSFAVNTPNWANVLPGDRYEGDKPDGFYRRDELVDYFEGYASRFELPVREGVTVTGVVASGDLFRVTCEDVAGAVDTVTATNIVIASGIMQTPKVPAIRERFPESLPQLHASEYRSPKELPSGAVVVIGGGQSGCQISMDLIRADRDVYLCTSRVGRFRRRYRQRDVVEWAQDMGFWDVTPGELSDPSTQFAAQPQVSGVGRFGSTLSLQSMSRDGVRLMGRLSDVEHGVLRTDDSLAEHVVFADERSAEFTGMIEDWIASNGIIAGPIEDDPNDEPAGPEVFTSGITRLDLTEAGVGSVIWCTGFTAEFGWIHARVTDENGQPIHKRGISPVPGIYFVGFPWLHSRKSGIIHGIAEDARFIAQSIAARIVTTQGD